MYKKIDTALQLSNLNKGDIITRFPTNGIPTDKFDDSQPHNTDVFEIRAISIYNVLELVAPDHTVPAYASPGDVRRLFIKSADMLTENNWWYSSNKN